MIKDVVILGPRHNIMGDLSSLSVLGATALHYLPEVAYMMPAIYYGMLSINLSLEWRKRWHERSRAKYREEGRVIEVKREQDSHL